MAISEFRGQIEHITYANEETGYTVAKVRLQGEHELITVVGNILSPTPGEVLLMKGEWIAHPQYGRQLKIEECRVMAPATVNGIKKYLGSGLIKGIGPVMAQRIVKSFGAQTLEIIEQQAEKLLEVEGIGPKRLEMIGRAWAEQREIRRVMIFLQEHGVSPALAAKIFKRYGDQAVELLRENPYRLAHDIEGIGFVSADRIAQKLGLAKDSPVRAEAGVLYILLEMANEGHVYCPLSHLLAGAQTKLEIDREILAQAIENLAGQGQVVLERISPEPTPDEQAVFLAGYYTAEKSIAARLKKIQATPKLIKPIDADKAAEWVSSRLNLQLAQLQIEAIKRAATDKVLVITGGPGTGKTTIIRAILTIFQKIRARVHLAAPTGRAAKRMSQATDFEAKTIHRLLEFSWQGGGFRMNDQLPLETDLLIVDEASMIDTLLMHHLLKAIPPASTLILVGDVDQLPAVGPGQVLADIINSGVIPVVALKEIFRQAKESSIIVNAHRINQGLMPNLSSDPNQLEDFYFINRPEPEEALTTIIELVTERIPKRFDLDPVEDIQILTPMHRGLLGAGSLNARLQEALNPARSPGLPRGGHEYRPGDKLMQIRNNYDKDVFNGDIGRLKSLDLEMKEAIIDFEGRAVSYDFSELDEVVPAYAISVHKAQGSEYPAVILPIHLQHYVLLRRNLIYTAVTRGRRLVVLVGSVKALAMAVRKQDTSRRWTRLAWRIKEKDHI